MKRQIQNGILLTLMSTSILASGCASTATGIERSALTRGPDVTLRQTAPAGTALAIVRYPAFVEADAEDDFANAFSAAAIGDGSGASDPVETRALADGLILKSNYYAMSLYRELAARLPEHSVLLSPHKITRASDGSLTSEPMTQAEALPSVVTVDFTAYSFPDSEKMMGERPLTFGDLVTPIVTVRTDPRTAVQSAGVLMASAPVMGAAAGQSHSHAIGDAETIEAGRIAAAIPELDFISYISGSPRLTPRASPVSQPRAGAVRRYPVEKIKLSRDAIETLKPGSADILEAPFSDAFANQVITMINETDAQKATMIRRAEAIAGYDENLAALTLVGSAAPDYQARFRYAERLLEAEQKYLSVQSLRLYDGIVNGEMGALVTDMVQEEFRVLQRRRQLAKQQNTATALAIFSAVAAGAVIAKSDNDGRTSLGEQIGANLLVQGAIFSATEAYRRNRLSGQVGANYLQSVVPALDATTEVQVNLIDSSETITAIRFEDLKSKLSELYAENQRALDTVATRCAFVTGAGRGTWLGACENGLAEGAGVGVFRDHQNNTVEHYGYARAGLADGPGYRILRAPTGASAIEGNFSQGEASGIVRVERAGSAPTLRRYSQGQDVGQAPAGTPISSPFTAPPTYNATVVSGVSR